jgi:hypothetical protein
MELNILNAPDGTALPAAKHTVPLWRILVGISLLIAVLLVSTILVCGTNEQCRARIPTLNNLLHSTFVAPFLITSMNAVLSLQLFISVGIYYKTQRKAPHWSRIVMLTSIMVYVSVVITLFVFPFTDWDGNYANVTIIVSLNLWMIALIVSLRSFYRHRIDNKHKVLFLSKICCLVYALASLAYVLLRVFPVYEKILLVAEIFSALALGAFLIASLAHIWSLEFSIRVP